MSASSLFVVLFLMVPFYSSGASVNKEMLKRTRIVFQEMYVICTEKPRLDDLVIETKRAYAKEHFGDPLESREVGINGVQLLKTYQDMDVQTFVPKTFKQLSIFHIVFQDVLQNWPRGSSGKRKIVNKVKAIANKVGELKQKVRIPAFWISGSQMDTVSSSDIPQLSRVWSKSVYQQNKWILGVLGEFDKSMRYLLPAFNKFARE